VRRFRKKIFSLQSETKRNEIRFACVSHAHAKNFFFFSLPFASFRFEFFASDQSKINTAYFRFVSLPKICCFASFSFCFRFFFVFVCFRCEKSEKKLFLHRSEKISLPFRFEAKMVVVYHFHFASFHFEANMMAVFRFCFASFRFEAKMMAVFRFFLVLFSLRSIFVSLQIFMFRIDAKQAKKALFFASKQKKFRFRFASFRFKVKMAVHPNCNTNGRVKNYGIAGGPSQTLYLSNLSTFGPF
jgi:hypothetical protein